MQFIINKLADKKAVNTLGFTLATIFPIKVKHCTFAHCHTVLELTFMNCFYVLIFVILGVMVRYTVSVELVVVEITYIKLVHFEQ